MISTRCPNCKSDAEKRRCLNCDAPGCAECMPNGLCCEWCALDLRHEDAIDIPNAEGRSRYEPDDRRDPGIPKF